MTPSPAEPTQPSSPPAAKSWPERTVDLLWGGLKVAAGTVLLGFALVSCDDLRALIPRISRVEALGIKVEVSRLQSALEQQARSNLTNGIVLQPTAVDAVLARALRVQGVFLGATILWVDDHPAHNLPFRQMLRMLGAGVEPARSTREALELAAASQFDLVISDILRQGEGEDGIEGLKQLRQAGVAAPAIFYVARLDRDRPVPETALGVTQRPDELLHLVVDGLERVRWHRIAPPPTLRSD